jgi:hypothetical protein
VKIQFLIAELEGAIHGAPNPGVCVDLTDADLRRLEAALFKWHRATLTEMGARVDARIQRLRAGQGKSWAGVQMLEGQGHD